MSKQIYIVTKGDYSDYSIHGVFEDLNLATEYASQIADRYGGGQVEEFEVKTNLNYPVGFRGYRIMMSRDGDLIEKVCCSVGDIINNNYCPNIYFDYNVKTGSGSHKYDGTIDFYVITDKGEEGAIKIANERRSQLIAENKFPLPGTKAKNYAETRGD